ncbi:MAG: SRPBCC domain-containing protein [Acidimicrobiia bacterium]
MNPELDLEIRRLIAAPRADVWRAWTDPQQLCQWWLPAPLQCRVVRLDVHPGGAMVTAMSEDGSTWQPHLDACYLAVEPHRRFVYTNAINGDLRPVDDPFPVPLTVEIVLADHPDGTDYHAIIRHGHAGARAVHEELGFEFGWNTVTDQLVALLA